MFKLSFNCNKKVLKINFKPLFKWTFAQNQCYRFSNDEQLSCSKFFKLPYKNRRKSWFPKRIRHFQMHSSFNFYLLNKASNEKVPKTKVVDLEILNNFDIQKFFIWGHENGEKMSLQNESLNYLQNCHHLHLLICSRRSSPSRRRRGHWLP